MSTTKSDLAPFNKPVSKMLKPELVALATALDIPGHSNEALAKLTVPKLRVLVNNDLKARPALAKDARFQALFATSAKGRKVVPAGPQNSAEKAAADAAEDATPDKAPPPYVPNYFCATRVHRTNWAAARSPRSRPADAPLTLLVRRFLRLLFRAVKAPRPCLQRPNLWSILMVRVRRVQVLYTHSIQACPEPAASRPATLMRPTASPRLRLRHRVRRKLLRL